LTRVVHRRGDIAAARLGKNLKHKPLLGEGNVLPPQTHIRVGAEHERKSDNVGYGRAPQAERSGRSPGKLEDGEHDVCGNRSSTHHSPALLEVRLQLAISAVKPSDGVPNSRLGEAQVGVPRVDGREVRLEAARGHAALLT